MTLDQETKYKLLSIFTEFTAIHGPYKRKDGRAYIKFVNNRLKRGAKSGYMSGMHLARALMCAKLSRRLGEHECVDHIDNNKTNDNINNLQIVTRSFNTKKQHAAGQHDGVYSCTLRKYGEAGYKEIMSKGGKNTRYIIPLRA